MLSLNLEKGISLNLEKEVPTLKRLQIGLGWQTTCDLDAIETRIPLLQKLFTILSSG